MFSGEKKAFSIEKAIVEEVLQRKEKGLSKAGEKFPRRCETQAEGEEVSIEEQKEENVFFSLLNGG